MPTSTTITPAISVRNLQKSYRKHHVLKGVNLDIMPGEIYCLLGTNGAGKTTLVRILATLLDSDGGEAVLCGFNLRRQPARIRSVISLTGQYAAVDDMLTGYENLKMAGQLCHVPHPGVRADNLLEQFGLSDSAHRKAGAYSGGMRRRLDIAMSIVGEPGILFLDEPTTGLDPQSRNEMWQTVRQLQSTGVTIFLTTQYLDEAEVLAERIGILDDGIIIREGNAAELKQAFAGTTLVLGFKDEAAYNKAASLVQARIHESDPQALTISILTDGSVEALYDILHRLREVPVAYMEQMQASLEDVFLSLVNNGREPA